jgi:hypothetical protein
MPTVAALPRVEAWAQAWSAHDKQERERQAAQFDGLMRRIFELSRRTSSWRRKIWPI